jgi:molecular chaperone DnaJ
VRAQQGFFSVERTCPTCHGRGQIIPIPAPSATARAASPKERSLEVNIPPGIEDGTRIRLQGEGEAGTARRAVRRSLYLPVSARQRELLEEFRATETGEECPQSSGFFTRLKGMLGAD